MPDKKNVPYILTNNYTISLYIILVIVLVYYGNIVRMYDNRMNYIKVRQIKYLLDNKENLTFFNSLSKTDNELLKVYIYDIIDKKKDESNKFNKIIGAMKNGCVSGFLVSSLAGASVPYSLITGLTFGSTGALYKALTKYKQINI